MRAGPGDRVNVDEPIVQIEIRFKCLVKDSDGHKQLQLLWSMNLSLMIEILVYVWICGEFSKLMVVYNFDEAQV
jgi:hypothetical protein